jgi:hypothetical protein
MEYFDPGKMGFIVDLPKRRSVFKKPPKLAQIEFYYKLLCKTKNTTS